MISIFATALGANQQPLALPSVEYRAIMPELILFGAAAFLMLLSSMMRPRLRPAFCAGYTIIATLVALATTPRMWHDVKTLSGRAVISGAIAEDHFAVFFAVVVGAALILSALVSADWLTERHQRGPEYFILMMVSAVGAMLMAAANDLIVVFLGLEIMSIALYVLVSLDRKHEQSREAAIKYFILGGFASAIFLYGIALTYGATGSTNLSNIANFLSQNSLVSYGILLGGVALLAVGFAFKIAAVPFHQWTPDVYQGAPTPVTGFMAAVAKAGAFAALLRVFVSTMYTAKLDWQPIILALAILTLLVGSIAACVQQNVKRMLAYSSISHAGYVLLGMQAASQSGVASSLFYLFTYTFMVIGSFAIVSAVEGQEDSSRGLEAFRGLAKRQPGLALTFTILLLAQAGVPFTSGFLAKFYVIAAQVQNGSYATAVFAMVVAAVAAYFYLRIVFTMYRGADESVDAGEAEAASERPLVILPGATQAAIAISLVVTVLIGVLPVPPASWHADVLFNTIKFAQDSAADFFTS